MAGTSRTDEEKRRFTNGNLYSERERISTQRSFHQRCKTMEFLHRMNVPAKGIDMIGRDSRSLSLEIGYTGATYNCFYEYRTISRKENPIAQLRGDWWRIVENMNIQQGDTVYFEGDHRDPLKFHVSLDKHETAVKVEDLYWV